MPIARYRTPVIITTIPRGTLAQSHHGEIDAVLKDLRFCSRHLKTALDNFGDELRTLERLYYKCKNQHRAALYFKRVSEMRRYGRRLNELDILECVDLLRASFVGLEDTTDHKALRRSSWSHVPEKPYVHFLKERLTACYTLVCKMRECFDKAYHHFALAMQTGAFVQFIILFVAICSRTSVLSSQLEGALQLGISSCDRLLAIIHPTGMQATTSQQLCSEPKTSYPSDLDHDASLEDTGQLVSFCEPVEVSTFAIESTSKKTETVLEIRVTPTPSRPTNKDDAARASQNVTLKNAQKLRLKKAKKKFDEIDEIFGF